MCCQLCISSRVAHIPARVIELLDITKYTVCNSAYDFLKVYNYRCNIDIKLQFNNSIALNNDYIKDLIKVNSQINLMIPYIETCPLSEVFFVCFSKIFMLATYCFS